MPVTRKWKSQGWSGLKNSQQNFTRQGYMLLFEDRTLLLKETVTMMKSRDVIHIEPASFWYISVSVIIHVLKKKALLFGSPRLYIYIYIYIYHQHVALQARISLILSLSLSLSSLSLSLSLSLSIYLSIYLSLSLSPFVSIGHCFWQFLLTTSCIRTELL